MAHEIEASDGVLFAEHKAWHGLGIVVEEAPSPREALRTAGLDWTVHKSRSISAEGLTSDRYAAIIRDDTQTILGVRWVWGG